VTGPRPSSARREVLCRPEALPDSVRAPSRCHQIVSFGQYTGSSDLQSKCSFIFSGLETGLADLVFTDYAQEVYCVSGRVLHPVIRAHIEMKNSQEKSSRSSLRTNGEAALHAVGRGFESLFAYHFPHRNTCISSRLPVSARSIWRFLAPLRRIAPWVSHEGPPCSLVA